MHTHSSEHTRSSGQPYCGARGAVGGSVPCSRVSPQSWYWRWREHLLFTPPTYNPCRTWESNRQPLGYKSNSLTIRPRLPCHSCPATKTSCVCRNLSLCNILQSKQIIHIFIKQHFCFLIVFKKRYYNVFLDLIPWQYHPCLVM